MSDLSHDSPGVQGLAQLGRNAIDRVSELEREREETIRKLRDPVAVHVAMLRGEIAVPPLAELLHVYGATFSDLDAANIELAKARETIRQLRAEVALYAEIASEHRRDEYGETETAAECVGRIIRERDQLRAQLDEYERERQEPVAWAWNDALGCMHVHCGQMRPEWVDRECSDATRAEMSLRKLYAAPPVPRVEQEPVAWVLFDDIFIAPKDMQDDPPNLECMKPLYAHPLALREPTDDECREIADRFLCEVANAARGVRTGRAMFNAVREVMKK